MLYFRLTVYGGWGVRYGVVAVRGADEEGNLLNDPAAEKERVRTFYGSFSRGRGLF